MLAAGIITGLIVWITLSAYAWSWIMRQAARSEVEFWEKVKAGSNSSGGGGGITATGLLGSHNHSSSHSERGGL